MIKKFSLLVFFLLIATNLYAAVVSVEKSSDGWQLIVDGQPFFVKGVAYGPTKVGESPDDNTQRDWMIIDDDGDGRIDVAYQSWVDKNRNNQQDEDEPEVGDFQLLKEMGANTIRFYHHPYGDPKVGKIASGQLLYDHAPNKALLRDLYERYGIRVMVGDLLGAYTIGSGADWDKGTDYTDARQRANMLKSVEDMVREFKDEPFLLMYALGNENNYSDLTKTNAWSNPEVYAEFVNEVVKRIHELDPSHPVVLVNGGIHFIDVYARHAPDVDILGVNLYRSAPSSISLWSKVEKGYDKPVLITEYGTANPVIKNGQLDEIRQYQIHLESWRDIAGHAAGQQAPGNAIGGIAFQWLDKWWQNGEPLEHNISWDGWNLEWHGIASQGNGEHSLFLRQLRQIYYAYQEIWKEEQ